MLDLSVIILTYNEELHIRRCLENVCPIAKKVFVVDSPSTDGTVAICNEFENVEVVVHKYPGNQAEQFNWALDNLKIETEWILRLDADEYLMPELVEELKEYDIEIQINASTVLGKMGFKGKQFVKKLLN